MDENRSNVIYENGAQCLKHKSRKYYEYVYSFKKNIFQSTVH